MADFNAAEYGRRIDNAKTLAAVTEVFNDVAKLGASEQKAAINAIESVVVSDWQRTAPRAAELAQMRMVFDMVDEMRGTPQGDAMRQQIEMEMPLGEMGRASSAVMHGIHGYKGEESHALVKTFVSEEAKVPASDLATSFGIARLMMSVQEKLLEDEQKPAPRQNPFRKPAAPGNFDL